MSKEADFSPTKRFFVEMLTRDIALEDAILDLLDNCLDGVARAEAGNGDDVPYAGYRVDINFTAKEFEIVDNCGGIPISAVDYAFRMGRPTSAPDEELATVGVYGIGMKRSIFKIGKQCKIDTSHSEGSAFQVDIDEKWLSSDNDWKIPIQTKIATSTSFGTHISIAEINESVARRFKSKEFRTELINKIVFAYSYIIAKGFTVYVNGDRINPNPLNIRYESSAEFGKSILPYIYKAEIDDVEVKLVVGFSAPLITEKEEEEAKREAKFRTEDAGWTIVCNDRIVVYKDKTELTGWGVEFPRYHTQFIAISGIVYFKSRFPSKLPITTTKRGVDANSSIFLKVRKHIVEGTKIFIDYTNKWKGDELIKESNARLLKANSASPLELIEKISNSHLTEFTKVKNRSNEVKLKPDLPVPNSKITDVKKMSFTKNIDDIELVADFLQMSDGETPSQIAEKCFDYVLLEAEK